LTRYLVLLRGINVGGKNGVPMGRLRALLEELGYADVATYIASGNVILSSDGSCSTPLCTGVGSVGPYQITSTSRPLAPKAWSRSSFVTSGTRRSRAVA